MVERVAFATLALLATCCAMVPPSAQPELARCKVTPEALARVIYQERPAPYARIEIGCAGCDDVYVAAEYSWLRKHYPRYTLQEHTTQVPVGWQDGPAPDLSCFRILTAESQSKKVCFLKSESCPENRGSNP